MKQHHKQPSKSFHILDALSFQSRIELPGMDVIGLCASSPEIHKRRVKLLNFRIATASILFAILTLLWTVVDSMAFPVSVWFDLLEKRGMVSLSLLVIAMTTQKAKTLPATLAMLALLFSCLYAFFIFGRPPETAESYSFFGRVTAKSYALLPFALESCIGLFPLTVVESLISVALLIAYYATSMFYSPLGHPIAYGLDGLWLMILLGIIASLSSLSQFLQMSGDKK